MRINADFTRRAVVRPEDHAWTASPAAGVERVMLDRIGKEVARATSIVRFAPGARFDAHTHGGGEEFVVLDGVFSDETGDFPAGTYVRNPVGTSHAPHTDPGCTILVKLHQFDPSDTRQFHIDIASAEYAPTGRKGVEAALLHKVPRETVQALRLAPGAAVPADTGLGGEEIFVLEGEIENDLGRFGKGSWLRTPPGQGHAFRSAPGALLWVKTGHLAGAAPA